jgi:putative ABC transport system permease protein
MSLAGWGIAFRFGSRNLLRNPHRSIITALAIAAAFLILIVLIGLLGGIREQLLKNGTELMLGHLQLHQTEYVVDRHVSDTIPTDQLDAFVDGLMSRADVSAVAPRVRAFGLISSGEASAGGMLLGLDPSREALVTSLLDSSQGDGVVPGPGSFGMLLGVGLAREIDAAVGTEVAVVSQASDGSLGNMLFTVSGLVRTGLHNVDRALAVTHISDLQALLALGPNDVHELAMVVGDPFAADDIAAELNQRAGLPAMTLVRSWGELSPQLRDYIAMSQGVGGFLILIVAVFAAFGVANSMLMAVFERTREFGTLNAIGTQPSLLLGALLIESALLAGFGLVLGLVLGGVVMNDLIHNGWDLTRITGELSLMETRLDPLLRGAWVWTDVIQSAIGLLIATLVASLIAGGRILRLDPVEAMSAPTEA